MASSARRGRFSDGAAALFLLALASFLVFRPADTSAAVSAGLTLCVRTVIPSLFPYFVLSSLTASSGLPGRAEKLFRPVMKPLFGVSGRCAAAPFLGLIGGYPVGAKTVVALYDGGDCTAEEAERLLSFCNCSGPAFLLGVVGAGVFASVRIGLLLLLSHVLAALVVGVLFRKRKGTPGAATSSRHSSSGAMRERVPFAKLLVDAVSSSFTSVLGVCGFILFFSVLLESLRVSGVLPAAASLLSRVFAFSGVSAEGFEKLLMGLVEVTSGVTKLSPSDGMGFAVPAASFLLGFGGLSVHCQVLSVCSGRKLRLNAYFSGKVLHGVLSALLTALLLRITPAGDAIFCLISAPDPLQANSLYCWITGCGFAALLLTATILLYRKHRP